MFRARVIPTLLVQHGGLYKTRNFANPRYIGDPLNAVRIFNIKEVDELVILDIEATRTQSGPDLAMISEVVGECFMPLTYGGGIRSISDAEAVFALGVEKVSLQTAALDDLTLVTAIADSYGSQSVTVSIDVVRRLGRYRLYCASRRATSNWAWLAFLTAAADAGAGEVLLTSVNREGTMSGLDLDLIRHASEVSTTPLVVGGGVGSLEDIQAGLEAGADAISVGSFVVFKGERRAVLITYPSPDQTRRLLHGRNAPRG